MHSQAEDSHYATFLKLLYVTNSEHMLDAVPRRYGGTLGWLFDHEIFRNWFEGRDSDILRLIGLPGAGKSVISRYFIEAVSGNPNGGDGPVWELRTPFVAYFFCSGRNEHHQTELSLLKTVIHQLLVQDRRLLDFVIRANDSNGRNGKFVDSLPVLRNTLKAMLGSIKLRRIFIVIDALNEMKRESWISFMSYIGDLIQFGIRSPSLWLKVLLTSRPEPKIEEPTHFERRPLKLVLLTHESVKQDVARFVRYTGTVINHANEYVLPDDLLQDITSEIILHADGIFLWASLAWQCFLGGADRGVMESRLQALRNLPSGLASLYCHILERMDQDLLSVSMEAFRWMSVTFRQITVDELETVVGLKEGQTCLSQLSLSLRPGSYVVDQLQKICPNLIRTNDRREVQFVHQSFKDFLLEGSDPKYRIRLLSAHRSVATLCLTCLAFEDLNTGRAFHEYSNRADIQDHDSVKSGDAFTNTPENFTFYRYAAQYWSHHARFWPECEKIWLGFQRLAASPSNLRYMWFYYRYSLRPRESTSYTHIKPVPALHIATFLDFQFFVRMLVATGSSPNQLDSDGNSALHSPDLNSAMCELLLRLGANPGIENKLGETPLSMALRPQYQAHAMAFATSNLLNVKASNLNGRSLLCHGVLREWMETTSIRSCVSSGITDQYEKDILEYVASMGRRSAIEIILADPGVWSTRSQQYWRKVLLLVVLQDWEDIALTVIKEVKSIDGIRDLNRKTILHWCVYNGRDRLLDAILDRKVCELNEVDANGRTALHYAAQERGYHAARRLLEEGALPAVPDGNLQTPLHVAAEHGSEAVLKLLLDRGVRIEEIDALGRTAVHWAATWDWQPIMECILQRPLSDAILTLKDRSGLIPLHLAALSGCPAIVALFLTSNLIDVNATDNNGNTPLHCAARGRSLSVLVSLLKTRGISINSVNRFKQTALDIATKTALEDLTKPLLEAGCRYSTFDPGTDNSKRYHPSTTPPQETPQTPDTLCLVTRDYFSAGA
jgi:ankyrin repeat protein